jgi:ketosteroid isomerase-like protein
MAVGLRVHRDLPARGDRHIFGAISRLRGFAMTRRTWIVGAAAIVLAVACTKAPAPLTDAERTALADSVSQVATGMAASFATPGKATVDDVLSYYVHGDALVHAEYGMIYPTYDAFVKAVRAAWQPVTTAHVTLDQKRVTVLDRDVVVFTALSNGTMKDSAGKETPFHEAWTAVYHRTPDGWKIAADHESTAPPAPPAPAKPTRRSR